MASATQSGIVLHPTDAQLLEEAQASYAPNVAFLCATSHSISTLCTDSQVSQRLAVRKTLVELASDAAPHHLEGVELLEGGQRLPYSEPFRRAAVCQGNRCRITTARLDVSGYKGSVRE